MSCEAVNSPIAAPRECLSHGPIMGWPSLVFFAFGGEQSATRPTSPVHTTRSPQPQGLWAPCRQIRNENGGARDQRDVAGGSRENSLLGTTNCTLPPGGLAHASISLEDELHPKSSFRKNLPEEWTRGGERHMYTDGHKHRVPLESVRATYSVAGDLHLGPTRRSRRSGTRRAEPGRPVHSTPSRTMGKVFATRRDRQPACAGG